MKLITRWLTAKHSPFNCFGTELPPHVLMMCKLILLGLWLKNYPPGFPDIFIPFFPFFDTLREWGFAAPVFKRTLQGIFLLGSLCVFFNFHVRKGCLLIAAVILLAILSSRLYYRNSKFFCSCMFLLAGLQEKDKEPFFLRAQIGLVYFGAGLNKFCEADWRSGQFILFKIERQWEKVAEWIPGMELLYAGRTWLAWSMCWIGILTEFFLAVALLNRRTRACAIWVGLIFHLVTVILFRTDFGIFLIAILASYLVLVDWPPKVEGTLASIKELKKYVLYQPIFYVILVMLMAFLEGVPQILTITALLVLFSPLTNRVFGRV